MSAVDVPATKLQAFALSAVIAAITGSLLSYQIGAVSFDRFDVFGSITLITLAYIGGVSVATGAVFAGLAVNGGVIFIALQQAIPSLTTYYTLVAGLLLLLTVLLNPDGVVVANRRQFAFVRAKLRRHVLVPPASVDAGDLQTAAK
jgi:ABC-type branched-subunit amino acid transport system permease subunit